MTLPLCQNLIALAIITFSHIVNAEISTEKHQLNSSIHSQSKRDGIKWLPDRSEPIYLKRSSSSQKSDEIKLKKTGWQPMCTDVSCVREGIRTKGDINLETHHDNNRPLSTYSATATQTGPRNGEEAPIGLSMTGKAAIQKEKKEVRSGSKKFLDAYHKAAKAAVGLLPSQMNQTAKKSLHFDATRHSKVKYLHRNSRPAGQIL